MIQKYIFYSRPIILVRNEKNWSGQFSFSFRVKKRNKNVGYNIGNEKKDFST